MEAHYIDWAAFNETIRKHPFCCVQIYIFSDSYANVVSSETCTAIWGRERNFDIWVFRRVWLHSWSPSSEEQRGNPFVWMWAPSLSIYSWLSCSEWISCLADTTDSKMSPAGICFGPGTVREKIQLFLLQSISLLLAFIWINAAVKFFPSLRRPRLVSDVAGRETPLSSLQRFTTE